MEGSYSWFSLGLGVVVSFLGGVGGRVSGWGYVLFFLVSVLGRIC